MSTLVMARDAANPMDCWWPSPLLPAWLRGYWVLLFSHPQDFVSHDLEVDRWLVIMRQSFLGRQVRPLALTASTAELDRSWMTLVSGDSNAMILDERALRELLMGLRADMLRRNITSAGERFVMIIDGSLCARKTFIYGSPFDLPAPIVFLGWIDAIRAREGSDRNDRRQDTRSASTERTSSRTEFFNGMTIGPSLSLRFAG